MSADGSLPPGCTHADVDAAAQDEQPLECCPGCDCGGYGRSYDWQAQHQCQVCGEESGPGHTNAEGR